ncbi:TonB-dependent receptor [Lysobacter sp. CFH 32150]|uniref:TonB-dependent receptor n=1 Tax=Lysobacter sp. CFH 32150 TaxID=2927128 RepID=UPI001FA75918|nr:TonB-dependent receptor [Lysobacter sp. CFH 32150]MCI4569128.1 TonB-dependent receptor [Lysobacter sp. CFH 32150]
MKVRKSVLSASIVVALGMAGSVTAQEAAQQAPEQQAPQQQDAASLDTIIVKGIRGAIEQSLESKRDEVTRVEVITSEDIGKMPDKNVADSLSRVSGVNISAASANEGAFDENDRVSMRGTSPSFTQTLIDGHNVATGDWFVLNQTGTVGRSVSYSLLPSELVDKVVVRKSSEAKLVEGGAVGSIDIITRNPLNFDTGFSIFGSVGAVYADNPGKTDPQISVLGNWKNTDGSFGMTVQVFSEERHLRRDGQELLGYEQIKATNPDGTPTAIAQSNPDLIGVFYPVLMGSALFEQERKRTGGMFTAQWKPTDSVELEANYFRSDMEADNYNRNYMLWGRRILSQGNGQAPLPGYVVRDNTLVQAEFAAVPGNQYGIYDQISRPGAKSSTEFFSVEGKWDVSDKLRFTAQGGTSEGHGETPTQDVAEWDVGLGSGAGWSMHGVGAADWHLGNAVTGQPGTPASTTGPWNWLPGEDYNLDWIFGYQDIDVVDKEDWLKLDGQYFVDSGALASIEFGVRGAKHERSLDQVTNQAPGCLNPDGSVTGLNWGAPPYFCSPGSLSPFDPANWPQGFQNYPGDFADGIGGNFPRDIWFFTPEQLAAFNRMAYRDPVARFDYNGAYALEERSNAAYVQFNLAGERWSGNVGVRFVQTKEEVTNYTQATDPNDPGAISGSLFGLYRKVVTEHTYNDWLPSANFKYELNDDVVLRLAASRTLTRPDFSALAAAVTLAPPPISEPNGIGTGTGGNPDLEPILSNNIDATVEWYFGERSLLSAGVFYMDIDNYVALSNVRRTYMTERVDPTTGTASIVPIDYDVTTPINSDAKVKGFELAWEQPFGDYFGAFANYTYADGETGDGSPMLGTSDNTYNVGAYFENDRFNARVNYTYRSEFYSGLDRNSAFFQDEIDNVSASLGYKISDHFSLALDLMNLNNPKTKYYAESKERPRSIYENGRQYYLSLRFKF